MSVVAELRLGYDPWLGGLRFRLAQTLRISVTRVYRILQIICLILLAGPLALTTMSSAGPPTSTFSFDGTSTITLYPGQENGSAVFVVILRGAAAALAGSLELQDRGARDRPEVTVNFDEGEPTVGDDSLTWFVTATVDGIPANTASPRFLTARFAGFTETLQYTLTNKPDVAFAWKVIPDADARRWDSFDPIRITVSVGSVPATAVRLVPSSFVDAEGLYVVPRVFRLCSGSETADEAACDGRPIGLAANETHTLYIRPVGTGAVWPGEYKGSFTLVAAEKPDGDSFAMTLHVSRWGWQLVGAGLIAVGLLLAWTVNIFLQRRNEQNLVLMPAALLVEQVANLHVEASRMAGFAGLSLGNAAAHLEDILNSLSKKSLMASGYIGSSIDFFGRPAGVAQPAKTYQQFLAEVDGRVALLSLLVEGGFRQAMLAWKSSQPVSERDIVLNALDDMDKMLPRGGSLPTRDSLAALLEVRLTAMRSALSAASGVQDDAGATARVGYSSERIAFETAAINIAGWVVFAALSFVVGCYVLIVSDPDFGQWKDLMLCLLWGFGLPVAGEKLATLSSPGVAKAFGVTLTRAAG